MSSIILGCSEKYCECVDDNRGMLNDLIGMIENNPSEFFNNQTKPRVYYTYNYLKEEAEFKKTLQSENISLEEYKSLKTIFKKLSIKEFLIYNNQNLLFKIDNANFFVSDYSFYISYLNGKSPEFIKKDIDIIAYGKCKENWYYILRRSSVAN